MKLQISDVLALYVILLLLGIGYNLAIGWLERQKYIEGFVSIFVAIGVIFILGGVAALNWQAALLVFGAFVFGGTPMIIGSIWRYMKARREGQQRDRQAATVAEPGEGGARPGC